MDFQSLPSANTVNDELEVLSRVETNHHVTEKDNVFVCEKGVKFKIQKMNVLIIQEAKGKIKWPEVPKVYIKEDDRWEENPSDPTYLHAWDEARVLESLTTANIVIGLGTYTQREWVPEGVDYVDGTAWEEALEFAGIEVPPTTKRLARYVLWTKLYVLGHEEVGELVSAVARYSGFAGEQEVSEAIESFPGDETWSSDNGAPDPIED
jgi:hypothetical protein